MHNHATPVAIIGALDSTPIRRLTLIWAVRKCALFTGPIAEEYAVALDT